MIESHDLPMDSRFGLFGKLPVAGDFLAEGASAPAAAMLQSWLVEEVERLAGKRATLPPDPIRFLARDPAGESVVLGVLGPSKDTVGRAFPIALMTHLDAASAWQNLAWIPAAYAPFLDQAAALVREAPALGIEQVRARLLGLPLPGASAIDEARVWTHEALQATPGETILEALFGPIASGVHFHGLNMFLTACARVRGQDPGAGRIVLECPAVDDVQLAFWLRFAHAALHWHAAPPSLFWTDTSSSDHRLLVCLGSPAPGILHFLTNPSVTADRLWPMRTQSSAAIEAGRNALPAQAQAALQPPAPTAAALLAALTGSS